MRKRVARHQCEVLGCRNFSQFVSPGNWCRRHWTTWFNWNRWIRDGDGKVVMVDEPEWMTNPPSRRSKP